MRCLARPLDILDSLEAGPMTAGELAVEIGVERDQIDSLISRMAARDLIGSSEVWGVMYRRAAVRALIDDRPHRIAAALAAMGRRRLWTFREVDHVATPDEIRAAVKARCVTVRPLKAWRIEPAGREKLQFYRDLGTV